MGKVALVRSGGSLLRPMLFEHRHISLPFHLLVHTPLRRQKTTLTIEQNIVARSRIMSLVGRSFQKVNVPEDT